MGKIGENSKENSKEDSKENRLWKILIKQGKVIMLILGIAFVLLSICLEYLFKEEGKVYPSNPLINFLGQIGGILISTAAVAFFYDKYKDEQFLKEMKKYVDEQSRKFADVNEEIIKKWGKDNRDHTQNHITLLSNGISEKVYVEYIDKDFVHIVQRPELDKNDQYCFSAMAQRMIAQHDKDKKKYPVLMYGSTLGIFNSHDTEKKHNLDDLVEAVKAGVHFKLALNAPEVINTNNQGEDYKKKRTIRNVLDSLVAIVNDNHLEKAKGSIDLRLLHTVEKNSFSSFICSDRRVCVLDFNFEDRKISQIFDEKMTKKPLAKESVSCDLALHLEKYYMTAHQRGVPYICFNKPEFNCVHVICIRGKEILMNDEKEGSLFPLIEIKKNVNIDKNIKEEFSNQTGYEIELHEFVSLEDEPEKQYFIIGFVKGGREALNVNSVYRWKDVYDKKRRETKLALLPIASSYRNKLKYLLSCYGIESTEE